MSYLHIPNINFIVYSQPTSRYISEKPNSLVLVRVTFATFAIFRRNARNARNARNVRVGDFYLVPSKPRLL